MSAQEQAQGIQGVQRYNGIKVYRWHEKENIERILSEAGYKCEDISGPVDVINNDGVNFEYIRYSGPDAYIHEIICLQEGQKAIIREVGHGTRYDTLGCYPTWDVTYEYVNKNGKIISTKLSGGVNLECLPRPEKNTRLNDVRDLYPL
jgi:hypothetical protein